MDYFDTGVNISKSYLRGAQGCRQAQYAKKC